MSSTRSPSPPGPATELLIISHGSPSEPEPQEEFIKALAGQVAEATGVEVRGATLAAKGALEAAVNGLKHPLVFPHFMADGWFVSTNMQNRLAKAGLTDWTTLTPLGLLADLPGLALGALRRAMQEAGLPKGQTTLIVAAHGSPSNRRPAEVTERFASALRATSEFAAVRTGYVDEEPSIEAAAKVDGPALVLPFFAARAGHVLMDLPEGLEAAGFDGLVLPPIGTWEDIPQLIAQHLNERAAA